MRKNKSFFKSLTTPDSENLLNLKVKFFTPIPNDSIVQEILLLIDSPRLLLRLPSIRRDLGVNSVPFASFEKLLRKIYEGIKFDKSLLKDPVNELCLAIRNPIHWRTVLDYWAPPQSKLRDKLNYATGDLRINIESYASKETIEQTILLGLVSWGINPIQILSEKYPISFPTFAILVHPHMTYEELKVNFKVIRDKYMRRNDPTMKVTDRISNIAKYHEWHWKNISGLSHKEIADEESYNKAFDVGQISTGINEYRMRLKY